MIGGVKRKREGVGSTERYLGSGEDAGGREREGSRRVAFF